jgi:hypothetical protein
MSALQPGLSRLSHCPSYLGEGRRDSFSGSGTVSGTEARHLPRDSTESGLSIALEAGQQMGQRWDRPVPKVIRTAIAQRDILGRQRSMEPEVPQAQPCDRG